MNVVRGCRASWWYGDRSDGRRNHSNGWYGRGGSWWYGRWWYGRWRYGRWWYKRSEQLLLQLDVRCGDGVEQAVATSPQAVNSSTENPLST